MDDEQLPPEQMRAADFDRDACAERLARALQEGRLDLEEYQDRLNSAMRAKTMGELVPLTRDLPLPQPAAENQAVERIPAEEKAAARKERLEPWRGLAAFSAVLVGIWGITSVIAGVPLPFWPLIPVGFMFMFTLASAISGGGDPSRHCRPPDRRDGDEG
ncbi:MAG: DUF1707 domain-containing protein [Nocardiopsaceae bacterium]|nr:DUF1707 domain-containing protein [Nocardiopsaceae bacterium]